MQYGNSNAEQSTDPDVRLTLLRLSWRARLSPNLLSEFVCIGFRVHGWFAKLHFHVRWTEKYTSTCELQPNWTSTNATSGISWLATATARLSWTSVTLSEITCSQQATSDSTISSSCELRGWFRFTGLGLHPNAVLTVHVYSLCRVIYSWQKSLGEFSVITVLVVTVVTTCFQLKISTSSCETAKC